MRLVVKHRILSLCASFEILVTDALTPTHFKEHLFLEFYLLEKENRRYICTTTLPSTRAGNKRENNNNGRA